MKTKRRKTDINIDEKPVLNLMVASDIDDNYMNLLKQFYDVNIVLFDDSKPSFDFNVDLILFTAGEDDISPDNYSENINKHSKINKVRDSIEYTVYNKFGKHIPKLGIGRGAQLLCILAGGRLIQHVEGHDIEDISGHVIEINDYRTFNIPSKHHQMMFPYDIDESKFNIIAHSQYYQSETYLDGNNQEIDLPSNFLEPEIIYFESTNALCIQGRPELPGTNEMTVLYCLNLIKKLIDDKLRNK